MSSVTPPKMAQWLLRHFACSPNNAAIMGDLDERLRRGRSRRWYWRQAINAVVVSICREILGHKLLTLQSITMGWLTWIALSIAYRQWLRPFINRSSHHAALDFPLLGGGVPFAQSFSMPFFSSIGFLFIMAAVSGWIVGRFSRIHRNGAVLSYAASMAVLDYILFNRVLFRFVILDIYVAATILGIVFGGIFTTKVETDRLIAELEDR